MLLKLKYIVFSTSLGYMAGNMNVSRFKLSEALATYYFYPCKYVLIYAMFCFSEEKDMDASLDSFLAKYTSEDNASFNEILEESERRHRQKHAWLFEKEGQQQEVGLPG
jgi:hypothetical protein